MRSLERVLHNFLGQSRVYITIIEFSGAYIDVTFKLLWIWSMEMKFRGGKAVKVMSFVAGRIVAALNFRISRTSQQKRQNTYRRIGKG